MSLSEKQIQLVEDSFAAVKPIANEAAAMFYARLFAIDPAVRALFRSTDLEQQGPKLMQALTLAVGSLRKTEALVPVLKRMGAAHAGYGVKGFDYDTVGAALLWTLEQGLGAAFSEEVREAWTKTYGLVATVMQEGAAQAETSAALAAPA